MHDAAMTYVAAKVQELGLNRPGVDVLDLGGRDVNGTTRHLFFNAGKYISVDIREGRGVDIAADAADVRLWTNFDVVVSTELLEHAERAAEIVATAQWHLRPGGVFVATMAGPGRLPHGASGEPNPPADEWYENVSPEMLDGWLRDAGFDSWDIDQLDTDVRCIARRDG